MIYGKKYDASLKIKLPIKTRYSEVLENLNILDTRALLSGASVFGDDQQRNPYYHYFLAKAAYLKNDFDLALQQLEKAIRLNDDEHQFYFLAALSQMQLVNEDAAESSFIKARRSAQRQELAQAYDGKLKILRAGQL